MKGNSDFITGKFSCAGRTCKSTVLEATPDGFKLNSRTAKRVLAKIDNNHDPIRCTVDETLYEVNVYYDGSFLIYPL